MSVGSDVLHPVGVCGDTLLVHLVERSAPSSLLGIDLLS